VAIEPASRTLPSSSSVKAIEANTTIHIRGHRNDEDEDAEDMQKDDEEEEEEEEAETMVCPSRTEE
jgi:hypothetical protein